MVKCSTYVAKWKGKILKSSYSELIQYLKHFDVRFVSNSGKIYTKMLVGIISQ